MDDQALFDIFMNNPALKKKMMKMYHAEAGGDSDSDSDSGYERKVPKRSTRMGEQSKLTETECVAKAFGFRPREPSTAPIQYYTTTSITATPDEVRYRISNDIFDEEAEEKSWNLPSPKARAAAGAIAAAHKEAIADGYTSPRKRGRPPGKGKSPMFALPGGGRF